MRRIAIASIVLLLGIGACTDTLVSPTDLQEEVALPATVRSEYTPGTPLGAFNPAGFSKTLQPGETDGQFVQVTVFFPFITSLTLEVCNDDKEWYNVGWLQSVSPAVASVPSPPVVSFDIVVGPPLGAVIKTHLFKICAVGNGTTFVASQQVTIVIPDITAPEITLLGSDPVIVEEGGTYEDAGASASDNVDGDISESIITVNPVDTSVPDEYTVTYNVSDAAGNPAVQVTRTVTVVDGGGTPPSTPKAVVEAVIDDLSDLLGESRKLDRALNKAIRELNRSLEDKLWLDDYPHPKHGKKVFDRQKKAVKELMKLLRKPDGASTDVLDAAEAAIDALVSANRQTALDELAGVPAARSDRHQDHVDREIAKAGEELDKGDSEAAAEKFDKAIDHYKKAWEHAMKAAKEAAK